MKTSAISPTTAPTDARARQTRTAKGTEILKQRIKQNVYASGQKLPSLRALSEELNLSVPAIRRAVQHLEQEGILETRHGVGTVVRDSENCNNTPLVFGFVQPYYSRFSHALQLYMEDVLDSRSNLCFIKSTRNDPQRERREISRLIESGVNGLLIWPVEDDQNIAFLQEIAQRIPVVFVDRTVEDVKAPAVVLDYESGAREIIRHLHKLKRHRILVVCDPSNISSFNQLKSGLREETSALGISNTVTILDYPVTQLIEDWHQNNHTLADASYEHFAPLLKAGLYDAIFCPQGEFYEAVFMESKRSDVLLGVDIVRLSNIETPDIRQYQHLTCHIWIADTVKMLVQAIDLLQDMTLARRPRKRIIRLPIYRKYSI